VKWVCSVCGSTNVNLRSLQQALGDPNHPLARCNDHQQKHGLSPLCTPDEYRAKPRRQPDAMPDDVFAALSEDERVALRKPIRLL